MPRLSPGGTKRGSPRSRYSDAHMRGVVVVALLGAGCVSSSSEANGGGTTGMGEPASTSVSPITAGDPLPAGCGDNLLVDPGFEGGVPNAAWEDESSLFGTPICNADCTSDVGAAPLVGDWWVWFGGVAMADNARVAQDVVIPEGQAMLRFGFTVNAASGTGTDVFSVQIDDEVFLLVSDAAAASYVGWRLVELDVSTFADGDEHTVTFSASLSGGGLTSFFLDAVELVPCEAEAASSSGGAASSSTSVGTSTSATDASSSG